MRIVCSLAAMGIALQAVSLCAAEVLWPEDKPSVALPTDGDLPAPIVPRNDSASEDAARLPQIAPLPSEPRNPDEVFPVDAACPQAVSQPLCRVKIAPYGWLPEMYGQVGIRNVTTEFGVTTRDLLNLIEHNVHFMFAGQMEAECGQWSITTSGLYMYAGFGTSIRRLSFSGNSSLAIVDAAVGHEIAGLADALSLPPGSKIELIAGGRYWLLGGSLTVTGPFGNSVTRGNDVDWVDPVVGARLTYALNPDTRFRIRGDVGGFSWFKASDDTWNVEAVFEKRCSQCCTVAAGYRILDVDYTRDSHERFAFDAQLRGPVTTLSLEF